METCAAVSMGLWLQAGHNKPHKVFILWSLITLKKVKLVKGETKYHWLFMKRYI